MDAVEGVRWCRVRELAVTAATFGSGAGIVLAVVGLVDSLSSVSRPGRVVVCRSGGVRGGDVAVRVPSECEGVTQGVCVGDGDGGRVAEDAVGVVRGDVDERGGDVAVGARVVEAIDGVLSSRVSPTSEVTVQVATFFGEPVQYGWRSRGRISRKKSGVAGNENGMDGGNAWRDVCRSGGRAVGRHGSVDWSVDASVRPAVFPEIPLQATATDSGETFAIATGYIADGIEGCFFLDFLTGDMQCWVINGRTGGQGGYFVQNVVADLGVEGGRKNPRYLMVTGQATISGGSSAMKPADSLVYVADATTGNFAVYTRFPGTGRRRPRIDPSSRP